jgi:hypothetical protein
VAITTFCLAVKEKNRKIVYIKLHIFSTIAFDLLLLWTLLPSNFKDENIF